MNVAWSDMLALSSQRVDFFQFSLLFIFHGFDVFRRGVGVFEMTFEWKNEDGGFRFSRLERDEIELIEGLSTFKRRSFLYYRKGVEAKKKWKESQTMSSTSVSFGPNAPLHPPPLPFVP